MHDVRGVQHRRLRLSTKWGRFEVRTSVQASMLQQHRQQRVHRLATELFLRPDVPIATVLEGSSDDDALLRGGVPQLCDWAHAWQFARTPCSFRTAAEFARNQQFLNQVRSPLPTEKAIRCMMEVMAEASRQRKRKHLRAAWSITLSLDDRGAYRIVSFRCEASSPRGSGLSEPVSHSGVLWTLWRGGNDSTKELEDVAEDKSQAMKESILRAVRMFCTPMRGVCDEELSQHILHHTREIVADGATHVQKVSCLLKPAMPNLCIVWRDPAHAAKKATHDPLKAEERCAKQWDRLFGGRHALVPDIKNSDHWRQKLELCQRRVVATDGVQGGGLTNVLRHLSFAQQRWDSTAEPHRKFCCMLTAFTMLLAMQASDERNDPRTRKRAQESLDDITPEALLTSGLTADYSAECLNFVRRFEPASYDPARIARDTEVLLQRMQALFLDAHILVDPGAGMKTCTQIVLEQAYAAPPLYYGDRCKQLWHRRGAAKGKEVMASMQAVVSAMLARVEAELHSEEIMLTLEAFDLQRWVAAATGPATEETLATPPLAAESPPAAARSRIGC